MKHLGLFCSAVLLSCLSWAQVSQQWVASYNGPGNAVDEGKAIAVNGAGNNFVAGPSVYDDGNYDYSTIKFRQAYLPLSASQSQTNINCNGSCTGSATVTASGGTPPYTYAWSPSGGNAPTTNSLCAGAYTCTITDMAGATITATFLITSPPALTMTGTQTNITCSGNCTGSASVSVTGGTTPYTYAWAPGHGTAPVASGLCAGNYTCTVTDVVGCTSTYSFAIAQPPVLTANLSQVNVSCNGANDASATVTLSGGTAPFTYAWSPSGGTSAAATNLSPGGYTCTATEGNGCTRNYTFLITQPLPITPNPMQHNISCYGGGNGHLMVSPSGGTPAYSYAWSPVASSFNQLNGSPAGNYTCTITDVNGCTATQTFLLTQPAALIAPRTQTNLLCNGDSSGTATVNPSGGTPAYTYAWSPYGGTASTATSLSAGTYSCLITDFNGCSITRTFNITQPPAIVPSASVVNVTCNGDNNGSIDLSVAGGAGPLTYSWNSGLYTTEDISALAPSSYSVTVTDSTGCIANSVFTVIQPAPLDPNEAVTNGTGCGTNDGVIDLSPTGGTPPYTYLWSSSATTEDISSLVPGSYTVTVTDFLGCADTSSFTVTEPSAPPVTYNEPIDTACQSTTVQFALSGVIPAGGTFSGPGVNANNFDPMQATTGYNVITYTYTDTNGCTASAIDSVWVDLCLATADYRTSNSIHLFPNPSQGVITISTEPKACIMVYDSQGQVVRAVYATSDRITIDLNDCANGLYLVEVQSGTQRSSLRLILSR